MALLLALSKPRLRRQVRSTGFFNTRQRENIEFVSTFAKTMAPADHLVLDHVLERMEDCRRQSVPFFLFANLFDVHAPYPPRRDSMFRHPLSRAGLIENAMIPFVFPSIGSHALSLIHI